LVTRGEEGVQKWKTEYGFVEGKNGFNCVSCGTRPVKGPGVSFAKNENRGFGTAKIARGAEQGFIRC